MIKRLEHIKETLMCAVEMEICNLGEVDTKELGEVVDMIKDIEEAIYYCTVTEAMKGSGSEMEIEMEKGENGHHYNDKRIYYNGFRPNDNMMYADDERRRRSDGTFYRDPYPGSSMSGGHYPPMYNDPAMNEDSMMMRNDKEGRSYNSRRSYMEAKEMKKDKASQLRELEKYMQELSQDITEMIADASPEEKQYLEKKISTLATKVGQMK